MMRRVLYVSERRDVSEMKGFILLSRIVVRVVCVVSCFGCLHDRHSEQRECEFEGRVGGRDELATRYTHNRWLCRRRWYRELLWRDAGGREGPAKESKIAWV